MSKIEDLALRVELSDVPGIDGEDINLIALGKLERVPGNQNWLEEKGVGGLPKYIEKIADSLHRKRGFTISRAIATAVSMCKRWARGGENVDPDTRARAARAIAEWEAKKAKARSNNKKG